MGDSHDTVTVRPFCMDVTEVTVDAYTACVTARVCTEPTAHDADNPQRLDRPCNWKRPDSGLHPVNCVDWAQAGAYCQWANKRLPTEGEWEWAARGQNRGTTYPWGDDAPSSQLCWGQLGTCRVGSYPAGDAPGGIHDLAGNVWEWTAGNVHSPRYRIARGGGWGRNSGAPLHVSFRAPFEPAQRLAVLGFRCVE
jgi:formylglycine-generating enzyme